MQQQFEQLAQDIVSNARLRYRVAYSEMGKLAALKDMGEQLHALKEAWEKMTGQTVTLPEFNEIIHITATV